MTEKKIAGFVVQGRGRGEGMDYRPWLTVHDLSSTGRVARILGRHNRRIHHLFSDVETSAFLAYDWRDDVRDIREQFPLDRGMTRVIAAELGVKHPRDPGSGTDVVMTTDLLVGFEDHVRAVACKCSGHLSDRRVRDKLEIERRYWTVFGVEWGIWTELSTTKVRTQNLAFLHEFYYADDRRLVEPAYWTRRSAVFLSLLARWDPAIPFAAFAGSFEQAGGFAPGDGVATMRFLACRKLIGFDLDVRFDHDAPLGRSLRPLASHRTSEAA